MVNRILCLLIDPFSLYYYLKNFFIVVLCVEGVNYSSGNFSGNKTIAVVTKIVVQVHRTRNSGLSGLSSVDINFTFFLYNKKEFLSFPYFVSYFIFFCLVFS